MWTTRRRWTASVTILLLSLALAAGPLSLASVAAASLVVTSGGDSGPGSLRNIIAAAPSGATITFAPGVTTVTLTSGELAITRNLTIAAGLDGVTITRSAAPETPQFRVLRIGEGAIVTLQRLTIANGIDNSGPGGGGIANLGGTLTLYRCVVSDNAAGPGGGILNYAYNHDATLTVIGTTISNNRGDLGGGIANESLGGLATVNVVNSEIRNNQALTAGGGMLNSRSVPTGGGSGDANLILTKTIVSGNSSRNGGGGILNLADRGLAFLALYQSTVEGNITEANGGGIENTTTIEGQATIVLRDSSVSGNTAESSGGGLFNATFTGRILAEITNSTFSGNSANHSGGAIASNAYVGRIEATLESVTLADNTADANADKVGSGHQVNSYAYTNGLTTTVIGRSVAAHTNDTLVGYFTASTGGTGSTSYTSRSRSISQHDLPFAPGEGDLTDTNPRLGPLADNGGATRTHALLPNSPAIDPAPTTLLGCFANDQRGALRPQGTGCDSGAYESGGTPPPPCSRWFSDLPANHPGCNAVDELFAQGIVKGYSLAYCQRGEIVEPCFGPDDQVQRAQVAAMIVRAFAWQNEPFAANSFDDLDGLPLELKQAILILNEKGIFQGYDSDSAGPNDRLSVAQAISIVARSFVIAGYWDEQPGASVPYTGVPAIHAADVATAHHYLGTIPNAPIDADSWNAPTSRAWVAWLLALALEITSSR